MITGVVEAVGIEPVDRTISTPLSPLLISINYQQSSELTRIAVSTVRHFISFDFTSSRQRQVNEEGARTLSVTLSMVRNSGGRLKLDSDTQGL